MRSHATCGTAFGLPPLREELQAAHDVMNASDHYHAFAVCRTHDGQAWEVNIRVGNIYSALDTSYAGPTAAERAGTEWLRTQHDRTLSADERVHREWWCEWIARPRTRS